MSKFIRVLALAVACLAGCTTVPEPSRKPGQATVAATEAALVAESYVSEEHPADELDSLAAWPVDDGGLWVIGSAKSTHHLVVFDGDSGQRLREVGGKGDAPGQFNRPNGVAVFGDYLFVVERDNHRVQVLSLPDFRPLTLFGADQLRSPYGLWLHEIAPNELDIYVTDSFMEGRKFDVVPPLAQLDQRVRRYRLHMGDDDALRVESLGAFGDTSPDAALRMVESIGGDPANDRLLIAEEDTRVGTDLREYDLAGRYIGKSVAPGRFRAQAEGVALWDCGSDQGYWVAVDQADPRTVFLLFDRTTLDYRGSFVGTATGHTDGIALHAAATLRFPSGALFAVHEDKAVAAFDLGDVARNLHLNPACVR
ncbi:phytase [Luteimonas cucumeris]|nr:phytase [Luteimonas cucumeris]